MSNNLYFAAKPAKETANNLLQRYSVWNSSLDSNGYLNKLQNAWLAYHGCSFTGFTDAHQVTFSGASGELANLPVNHLRNLAQHMLIMTTANRPTMEARPTNTDHKSLTQAYLATGLLDYYMREKRLEVILKRAVEYAIVLGAGFIKMAWNETTGEKFDFNEDTNSYIYQGDVEFNNLSPFDVLMDSSKEDSSSHDWYVTRIWKNRHDVAAKFPEFADEILAAPTKTQEMKYRVNVSVSDETDDIAVYEFFHRRTESLPDGRYLMFTGNDCCLMDTPLPYRVLPVFRIAASDVLGTPFGYTSIFDLLPMQEAINASYSTILTNQNAFGVQNILVPRGADISMSELTGGLNVIEANMQYGRPEALNLTHTPQEVFTFTDIMKAEMETISGISSVSRGNPEASLRSGAALALVQSMSIQFMSGLQQSYVQLIEDVGSALIYMLRDFASVPRVAAIVGKDNRAYMREFKGDDLTTVNRVIVDVGNPLAKTTAGRVQIAEQLLQMGAIKDPQQYFTVLNTGSLGVMTEGAQKELFLIKSENESMMAGQQTPVIQFDDHQNHILEHKAVLSDPELRNNPELVNIVLTHIQEHITALRTADPYVSQLTQQPPPPPAPPAPVPSVSGSPDVSGQIPQPGSLEEQGLQSPDQSIGPLLQQVAPGTDLPRLPSMPKPPAPNQNAPINPAQV